MGCWVVLLILWIPLGVILELARGKGKGRRRR